MYLYTSSQNLCFSCSLAFYTTQWVLNLEHPNAWNFFKSKLVRTSAETQRQVSMYELRLLRLSIFFFRQSHHTFLLIFLIPPLGSFNWFFRSAKRVVVYQFTVFRITSVATRSHRFCSVECEHSKVHTNPSASEAEDQTHTGVSFH